ncbi:MAG TPA: alpha/beta hydrolase [Opitutaceae bacterium]|nr:alpha/beta hydrolase [Opitutaceae bacterium]
MILLLVVGGYVTFAILARLLAPGALYHARFGSFRAPDGMRKLPAPGGGEVAVLHLPNAAARFTLWFFHGNAEDLGDIEPGLRALRDEGFAVFASEYPGYGHSSGQPAEEAIYAAARTARDYLRHELQVPAGRTILYGRSLGGGPATQMATEERVGGIVLQSAFTSVYRVVTRWPILPFDSFENERKLARVQCPVLIMHGGADEVIPFHHGESLFAAARAPKRHLWVPVARHNDFSESAATRYSAALREFSDVCAQTPGGSP